MTWFILAFNFLMVIWIVTGVAGVADSCAGMTGSELDACQAGTAIGATIGVGLIVGLWVAGDVILASSGWSPIARRPASARPAAGMSGRG
jgi:hypothetical protein